MERGARGSQGAQGAGMGVVGWRAEEEEPDAGGRLVEAAEENDHRALTGREEIERVAAGGFNG